MYLHLHPFSQAVAWLFVRRRDISLGSIRGGHVARGDGCGGRGGQVVTLRGHRGGRRSSVGRYHHHRVGVEWVLHPHDLVRKQILMEKCPRVVHQRLRLRREQRCGGGGSGSGSRGDGGGRVNDIVGALARRCGGYHHDIGGIGIETGVGVRVGVGISIEIDAGVGTAAGIGGVGAGGAAVGGRRS